MARAPKKKDATSKRPLAVSVRRLEGTAVALIALALVTPLIVLPKLFIFPFVVPKILFFRTVALALGGVYATLWIVHPERYRPRRTPLSIAVGLFLLSFCLSTLFGVDVHRSLWDTHERMLGMATLLCYGLFYLAATQIVRTELAWTRLTKALLFCGTIVCVLAIAQKLDPQILLNRGDERVSSTLGHASYLGGFGLYVVFSGLWLGFKERTPWAKALAFGMALLGAVGIVLSETRGTFIGLTVGLFVLLLWYAITLRERRLMRVALWVALLIGILAGSLAAVFRDSEIVEKTPGLRRFSGLTLASFTVHTRVMAWGIATEAWREHPVLGWGPNNYYHAFNRYYRPDFLKYGVQETWFDNAHNVIMNTLAVQGTVGLVLYLGLFALAVYLSLSAYRRGAVSRPFAATAVAFMLGHLAHVTFGFENATSYLYFFFFLAMLNRWLSPEEDAPYLGLARVRSGHALGVFGVVAALVVWLNVLPALANMRALKTYAVVANASHRVEQLALWARRSGMDPKEAMVKLRAGEIAAGSRDETAEWIRSIGNVSQEAGPRFERSLALGSPHNDGARGLLLEQVAKAVEHYAEIGWTDPVAPLARQAFNEFQKNLALHPLDVRTVIQVSEWTRVVQVLGSGGLQLHEVEALLEQSRHLSPERQQLLTELAWVKIMLKKPPEALQLFREVVDLAPDQSAGYVRLAGHLSQLNQHQQAKEVLERARENAVRFTSTEQAAIDIIRARAAGAR